MRPKASEKYWKRRNEKKIEKRANTDTEEKKKELRELSK